MPGTTIESFVDDIAKRSNIDPAAAETAVGTILSVILQEGKLQRYRSSSTICPVRQNWLKSIPVVPGSGAGIGGTLSGLAGKLIGADAGVMVAALAQIEQTGLSMQQVKNIGGGLLSYIEDVNTALAKEIFD